MQQQQQPPVNKDPFADLTAFNLSGSSSSAHSSQSNLNTSNGSGGGGLRPNASAPRLATGPNGQPYQPPQYGGGAGPKQPASPQPGRPNYSSSLFNAGGPANKQPGNVGVNTGGTGTGLGPAPGPGGMFDDLLQNAGGGAFPKMTTAQKANQTLKDIKRANASISEVDPDKVRVMEWTDGKKANIRALLCSMDKVCQPFPTSHQQLLNRFV